MATPFIGQLMAAGFSFAPKGWTLANGQTLAINQYQALFSLLTTTFGGDGVTTFQLPNLQGRIPMGVGSAYNLGNKGGEPSLILAANQVPPHGHTVVASSAGPTVHAPASNALASNVGMYVSGKTPATAMNSGAVAPNGGSVAHENRQPFLVINWCIALTGIFPSRS
jgi:microcystin-dependent protein